MVEIKVSDSIGEIEEKIDANLREITQGRKIEELSDSEITQLNEMYKKMNIVLTERLNQKNESIKIIKGEIRELLNKMKVE